MAYPPKIETALNKYKKEDVYSVTKAVIFVLTTTIAQVRCEGYSARGVI